MALNRRPAPISWVKQITISLEAALTDQAIDLEGAHLADFTVLSLTGAASVKVWDGGISFNALDLTEGQSRSGFDADGFSITTTGSTGGTATLEMHGEILMLNQPSTASRGANVLKEITVDLSSSKTASALDLGDIKTVSAFVVRSITGSAKIGMNGYYVTVAAGEAREGLEASSMTVTTDGSTGGTMILELRGRK